VIVDFGNVDKWRESLGWNVGIQELANLVKNFSTGSKFLRRFYYGSDYGRFESSTVLTAWSRNILDRAKMNGFEIVTKRVKYIHSQDSVHGFEKKCDLDVEMAVDLIKERDNYDNIVIFSGDGDLAYAIRYLADLYAKGCIVFGARNHIGREIIDTHSDGTIQQIFYAEDFEYRLNMNRQQRNR
jgi:uncharacterized LabA/DUF88 family protein